jgi:hypothetical protein
MTSMMWDHASHRTTVGWLACLCGLAASGTLPGLPHRLAGGAEPSVEARELRVGIIGLDTSHAPEFVRLLNKKDDPQHVPGCRVVAACHEAGREVGGNGGRVPKYTADVRGMGVEIVDGIDQLLPRVDAVLLETNDGRQHLGQAVPVLVAGKPIFIDKPITASLADAIALQRLAERRGTPMFSSSALRFGPATAAVRGGSIGPIVGCDTFSPCTLEPTHPDLFWYGIHGCESLFTVMGPGCEWVSRNYSEEGDFVIGTWKDGRIGTFRGLRRAARTYGGTAFGEKATAAVGAFEGYRPLVVEIVKFLQSGRPPVAAAETLEIVAFMEAADESKRQAGGRVSIDEMMKRAGQKADEILAGLDAAGGKPVQP